MSAGFVHLRVHSEYSLVDSVVRIKPLMARARELGMPAVAITDHVNLFALVKFFRAAQGQGIKPIAGVDLLVDEGEAEVPSRLTLLCQNQAGFRHLTRLVTRAYREGQRRGVPVIQLEWLEDASDGLIALSGAREGRLGRALFADRSETIRQQLDFWSRWFPDRYFVEIQRTGRADEETYLQAAVDLADSRGLPLVATQDVRFLAAADFEAHEVRVCINSGRVLADPRRPRHYSAQQYLTSPEEMVEKFSDLPEALENTVEIARRCNLSLRLGENFLPKFPTPGDVPPEAHLRAEAEAGLATRLAQLFDPDSADFPAIKARYAERLARELGVIESMGFPGYFLIVADFIRWAQENDVPVGPGRGSGAGSLVAYALRITDLDPLAYDLLFERFLNPERVSMPDFDIDFCMDGRDRVIDYVARRYGAEQVCQIITFGSMAAKAVVRDVGRVLGHSYGFVDRIAKLIPFELGMTLTKALEQEPELAQLYREDEVVSTLLELALALEGLARNPGKHAGGVVIAPSDLTDFTPLYCEPGGENTVTQFDKDDVESVGLVKFDFLGLRTLTIIDWAVKAINRDRTGQGEAPVDVTAIPLDDPKAYVLLKEHQTTAVFQLESRGMKDLIKRLQPDCFEDIVALVALFRPGPLQSGMVDDFINRKHGRAKVEYPHPDLEPILKPTYGVILYQEQVMQIAQVLAGYTLGGADLLRRAMGKKKPEEMAKQRTIFLEGAQGNGVDEATATYIFDLMEKFAGYGFNKSHSAAYALLSYQTAWLKAHFPAQFMAAVLSSDMDNTDKVVTLIEECHAMRLSVLPPDVNASDFAFSAVGEQTLRYGLGAIKGVGRSAIDAMLAERNSGGPFADLLEFCRRVDLRKINRRVVECLIKAGALDSVGHNRATLMAGLERALKIAEQHGRDDAVGQDDLFGLGEAAASAPVSGEAPAFETELMPEWDEKQRLKEEKDTLGLYLTGHPINEYEADLAQFTSGRLADVVAGLGESPAGGPRQRRDAVVAGLVVNLRRQAGRRAFLTLDDRSGRIEVAVFEEQFQRYAQLLTKDNLLVVEGQLSYDDFSGGYRMSPKNIMDLDQARERYARRLRLVWPENVAGSEFVSQLGRLLDPYRDGQCQVWIGYQNAKARVELSLGSDWRVRPCEDLLQRLQQWLGRDSVRLDYSRQAAGSASSPSQAMVSEGRES